MNNAQINQAAKIYALQTVLVHVSKIVLVQAGIKPETVQLLRDNARDKLSREVYPGFDAAWSDHLSAEIEAAVDEIFSDLQKSLESAWSEIRRATGPQ